ncbi:hypothetical protein [Pendulispora albinea]|uniref:Uncharacterized protein n=1 Tax=Pendulispora albinea TaxID=2741071 RepID=A0ABZ2LYT3_9BACT
MDFAKPDRSEGRVFTSTVPPEYPVGERGACQEIALAIFAITAIQNGERAWIANPPGAIHAITARNFALFHRVGGDAS